MKSYNQFELTEAGKKIGEELWETLWTQEEKEQIDKFLDDWIASGQADEWRFPEKKK